MLVKLSQFLNTAGRKVYHPRLNAPNISFTALGAMKKREILPAEEPAESEPSTKRCKSAKSTLPSEPTGKKYDESMRANGPKPEQKLCIMSWNVAGLRALVKKNSKAIKNLIELEEVDVLCLQEHKLQAKHIPDLEKEIGMDGWELAWSCSEKPGYSGTAILYKKSSFPADNQPVTSTGIDSAKHDNEGRVMTIELPYMYVVNVYVPNSGAQLKRLDYRTKEWDVDFSAFVNKLQEKKPVVLTGDMNCAREPIDIHNAKGNLKSAGFTPEERESFHKVYIDAGWIDTFREQHPGVYGYTYYGYRQNMRQKGKGWRLDYFLVSPKLGSCCQDSFILQNFLGSDHCPLGLVLDKQAIT